MQRLALIQACLQDTFRLRLGDQSTTGLVLTALYVIASLFMLRKLWLGTGWLPRERMLWAVSTALMLVLTVNKQMDLQQTIVWTGRCVARAEGWFDQRIAFQRAFGVVVIALVAAGAVALIWACRAAIRANRALLLGMGLMLAFVILQVARFEQLSGGLAQAIVSLRLHRILEGTALCVLIWAALVRRPRLT